MEVARRTTLDRTQQATEIASGCELILNWSIICSAEFDDESGHSATEPLSLIERPARH